MKTHRNARRQSTLRAVRTASNDREPRTRATHTDTEVQEAPVTLSAKITRALDAMRVTFTSYTENFAALEVEREKLAPKFMALYHQWREEIVAAAGSEAAGSFVNFVRVLNPDVPADAAGYKAHSAYNAADYLRRVAARLDREETTPEERARRIANAPLNPRVGMARTFAAVLPLLAEDAVEKIFAAMGTSLHWTENQIGSFRELVNQETPLVRIQAPKEISHTLKVRSVSAPDAVAAA